MRREDFTRKFWLLVIGLILGWSILNSARQITKAAAEPNILPAGQKIKINDRYSFQCVFPRKPRLGAAVLKINVFDAALPAADKKTAALIILAGSDMPAMRGHHAAPPQPVKTNKNKDYLFPVDLVMRGEWEIVLSFQENDREIYRGVILLKV